MTAPALPPTQRFVLELAGGHRVVGDHLAGDVPGYLFLHGLGSLRAGEKSASLLRHAAAQGRSCTRFDFRGHGESSGMVGQVLIGELVADTCLVLERFGPAHVIGSSLGGIIGVMAAATVPALVPSLALLAPALGFLPHLGRLVDANGWLWTREGRGFPLARQVLDEAAAFDEDALPDRLTMPVLLVHGTADDVVSHRQSEQLHARIPHARKDLWIVPDGDHRLAAQADAIWPRFDRLIADR
ncbi:MAG: alpha/beta fold hydrolase [Planctomycetes bacterium]|nr:alpha/beta fold hydrolase [Planctomycetota bacterium]MCB9884110.1 alpha/beta fold hydrolase [Planctomycetota bacterium]